MNCQKSYRRLLNFIISIVILFSGLYFNQTEADAFLMRQTLPPSRRSAVLSFQSLRIHRSIQASFPCFENLLYKRGETGACTGGNICPFYRSISRYTGAFFLPLCYFSEPILSKTIISQQKILCYIHAQDGKKSSYFSV